MGFSVLDWVYCLGYKQEGRRYSVEKVHYCYFPAVFKRSCHYKYTEKSPLAESKYCSQFRCNLTKRVGNMAGRVGSKGSICHILTK